MKLYGYFRSSAAFRVRAALNLKGLEYEDAFIHLGKGDQFDPAYAKLNPQHQVPTLVDGETALVQSPAILEYLDEVHPEPPFLPAAPEDRARVRAIAMAVACDMHPLNNLRILKYLSDDMKESETAVADWFLHWIEIGFSAIETMLAGHPKVGKFCHGDAPTLADLYLVPQVFSSRRFDYSLAPHPTIAAIFENCMALDAFDKAQPSKQADAE